MRIKDTEIDLLLELRPDLDLTWVGDSKRVIEVFQYTKPVATVVHFLGVNKTYLLKHPLSDYDIPVTEWCLHAVEFKGIAFYEDESLVDAVQRLIPVEESLE